MRILFLVLILSLKSFALEYGCDLHPSELNDLATKTAETFRSQKKSFPESLLITVKFEGTLSTEIPSPDNPLYGTVEGFYRPLEDAYYSVIPIPILGVALSRDKNVLYSCAHFDEDPQKTHLTIYMMRGSKLDPLSLGNILSQMSFNRKLEVKPLTASLLGVNEIRDRFLAITAWIPIFNLGYQITDGLQSILANALGDFSGLGVERITLTMDYIEIASGVDLKNPRTARMIRTIRFKSDKGVVDVADPVQPN